MPSPAENQTPEIVRIIDPRQREGRTGRYAAAALALVVFLAMLAASFYPFQPVIQPRLRAKNLQRFWESVIPQTGNLEHLEPGHLCLNFFFYFPLGVLISAALSGATGNGFGRRLLRGAGLASGLVMSVAIEYLQTWFHSRDPDLTDAIMNTLGYTAGFGIMGWLIASRRFSVEGLFGPERLRGRQGIARVLGIAYGLALLAAGLLRPALISEGYGFQGLPSPPFALSANHWRDPLDPWNLRRVLIVAAIGFAFIPVGFLFRASHYFWSARRHLLCLALAAGLAAVLEVIHITLPGKSADWARIAGATLGALAGADLAGWRWLNNKHRPGSHKFKRR